MKTKDLVQDEALNAISKHRNAGIGITVGGGKTLLGLKHMAFLNDKAKTEIKALVVAPKKSIFDSWVDQSVEWGYENLMTNVTFTTYRSLLKRSLDYDVVYLDECHSLKFSHDQWLKNFKGIVVGLTGTPPKYKNGEKGIMVNRHCPIIYSYLTDEAVQDKILNDYRITVHMLSLDKRMTLKQENSKTGSKWTTSELKTYQYWTNRVESASNDRELQRSSIMRMKAMQDFPSKELYAKDLLNSITKDSVTKCIAFANTQKQADKLCEHSYHSKNPNSKENLELFKDGTINKLSCVLQLSEGVNIPNLKEGIIMHSYGNNRKSSQRIGRLLRLNPDDVAHAHILCYKNTIDERWVTKALNDYDATKIKWYDTEII